MSKDIIIYPSGDTTNSNPFIRFSGGSDMNYIMEITDDGYVDLSVEENIVTSGLTLYLDAGNYESYSGGTNAYDLTGNVSQGTLANGVYVENSWFLFDGTNDELYFPNDSVYKTQEVSVDFWINLNYEATGRHVMFTTWYGFTVEINNPSGLIKWGLAGLPSQYMSGGYITYGQTHHLSCSYNPVTDSQKVYLDGSLSAQQTVAGTINYGTSQLRFSGSWDRTYGKMGAMKIYNRELSASEVLQNYNAQKHRFGL